MGPPLRRLVMQLRLEPRDTLGTAIPQQPEARPSPRRSGAGAFGAARRRVIRSCRGASTEKLGSRYRVPLDIGRYPSKGWCRLCVQELGSTGLHRQSNVPRRY